MTINTNLKLLPSVYQPRTSVYDVAQA